jgi:hypothetical protein
MSLFGFEIKRYLRGFLLLAIATAVFSLVNLAVSSIPDSITIGGDLGELCGNATSGTATPTPAPTPTPSSITNISFYDPFNTLDTTYWKNLTNPWRVVNGYVRTNVSDASYNNAIYYIVDFVDTGHDTVKISTRVRVDTIPSPSEVRSYCVFLSTVDLNTRVLGCIETFRSATGYDYVYARVRTYTSGSVRLLASLFILTVITGTRDFTLTVVKINETHSNITLEGIPAGGSPFSTPPITIELNWNNLGYFGLYMSVVDTGFDFIEVWITSQYAAETVYYNVNFPPPLPVVTTTTTVTETKIIDLSKDILVLPVGSFIRVLSFAVYVVYIVRTIKHFTPEF